MRLEDYNRFCASLPQASYVVQWGGAHVWKVGGKVFALGRESDGEMLAITFKCTDLTYDILREQPGLRAAPYLASRGLKWIQRFTAESMDDTALEDYLRESYRQVLTGLPRKLQKELGLGRN